MAATNNLQMDIFVDNFSFNEDTKVIQVANPMFLHMANQLAVYIVTSQGRHIEFQDGRQQQPPNVYFRQ